MNGRRMIALLLALLLTLSCAQAEESSDKYTSLPDIFKITVEESEHYLGDKQTYVYKEHLVTVNDAVNAELAAIVDDMEAEMEPQVTLGRKNKGKRESMLNTIVIWYRTGDGYVSTMEQSCFEYKAVQQKLLMTTRTYDLNTGDRVLLTDLFPEDSEAWDVLAAGVRQTMESLYPALNRDNAAIDALCTREALAQADFTLSGMELTLHYPAAAVFAGQTNLMRVRFMYPQFEGMMSEVGVRATDNSRWKMVSVTCDDGPKDYASSKALNNFRKMGARTTYFNVGKQLDKYGYVFIRQQDQNMLFGCHTFVHASGASFKTAERRRHQLEKMDEVTQKLVGESARYFRAPGGTYNEWIKANMPVPIIQWSLDTKDFTGKSPKSIFKSVTENVKEGDIILVHDTGKYEHEAILLYGEWMAEHGFMMVTLDELAAAQNMTPEPNVLYWSFRVGENSVDRSNVGKKK